jgi:hypothetical protein
MRTHIVIFMCFSTLLSGCMTANTALFKPEPDSGGDWIIRILGGIIDIDVGMYSVLYLGYEVDPQRGWLYSSPPGWAYPVGILCAVLITATDVAIRNSLPYRKAFYQNREAENENTKPKE